jgi:hypothetical protein
MAIRTLTRRELDRFDEALALFEEELRREETAPAHEGAPVFFREDSGLPGNYTHWYVAWDGFDGVDGEERSRLILAAIRNVLGKAEALRVTIAMGLTVAEARDMELPV